MSATKNDISVPAFTSFTDKFHHKPYPAISPTRPELSVKGKDVFVTGGGTTVGKAIATAFAQAGASTVSILGRRENILQEAVKEIESAVRDAGTSTKIYAFKADLTKRDQVDKALESLSSRIEGGKISIMVSNAGYLPTPAPLLESSAEAIMETFDTNVLGTLNLIQAFVPRATPDATFINVSSGLAHMAPVPGVSGYQVGKAANLKLVDSFAAENPGFHVVSIQPGVIESDMSRKSTMDFTAIEVDEPELAGQFAVWLASPEAKFLKGRYLWSNWDVEELKARADEIQSGRLLTWLLEGVPM